MTNTSTYTALDLLNTVIEFTNMTPDSKEWNFECQKDNTPRFVRLEQIMAMMWAFVPELSAAKDIGRSIEDFCSGDFIARRPIEHYASLLDEIQTTIANSHFGADKNGKISVYDLPHNYYNLLNYYVKLKKLINFNSGMMEISYPYYFSYIVTGSVSNSISSNAEILSRLLVKFIDPLGQSFTKDELIERYYYPDEDLLDLDLNWM